MPALSDLLPDDETLLGQLLAFAGVRAPQWATGDRDYAGKWARGLRRGLSLGFRGLRQIDRNWPPSADTDKATLQTQANVFGLSDGEGGYGFLKATPAVSIQVLITGTGGITVAANTQLVSPDGATTYALRFNAQTSGAAPGTGQVIGVIDALTPGAAGNVQAGVRLGWVSTPAGIDATVTVIVGTKTGTDEEDPGAAYLRLADRLRLTPKGGAAQDYRAWTQDPRDATGRAVFANLRAYGYNGGALYQGGGYDGVGAAVVVLTVLGSGLARIPNGVALQLALDYVRGSTSREGLAPNSHSYRAIPPYMVPTATGLVLTAAIVPAQGKPFAWSRGGVPLVVDTWDGVSKLRLTGLAPASLKGQIQLGQRPLLYVDTRDTNGMPTGLVIPPQAAVELFSDAGGKTTLTLQSPLPPGFFPPRPGDEVYPGHDILFPRVAQAVVDYVDSLGPSRVSGLQDPFDSWSSTVSPSGIDAAVKGVLVDGKPLVDHAQAGTAQIGVGARPPAVQDLDPPDNGPFGPGLWYALRVVLKDPS